MKTYKKSESTRKKIGDRNFELGAQKHTLCTWPNFRRKRRTSQNFRRNINLVNNFACGGWGEGGRASTRPPLNSQNWVRKGSNRFLDPQAVILGGRKGDPTDQTPQKPPPKNDERNGEIVPKNFRISSQKSFT